MKRNILTCLALSAALFFAWGWGETVGAEEIYLENGDRISGRIIEDTEEAIVLETAAMGRVTILKDFLEPAPEPEAVPEAPWKGKVSIGYNQAGGNTEKSQMNLSVALGKKSDHDEWTFRGDAYYASSDKRMDAKKFYGMGRYAYSFGADKRWYHFYKIEADQDRFANIDYRLVPSVGLGRWFADTEDWKAMAEMAAGFEHTRYRDGTDSTSEAILVPRGYLEKRIVEQLRLSQDLVLYPSLSHSGQYRLHSETTVTHPINDRLSWKLSFIEDYNSRPQGGAKKNDYRLITGLDCAF